MTPYYDNGVCRLYHGDARSIPLPDLSVHCVVTSPPYYGLRVYQGVQEDGIGLEPTVEEYVSNLVDVFREVRRVLRNDGILWLNLGDSYGRNPAKGQHRPGDSGKQGYVYDNGGGRASSTTGMDGNRLGIPERVVLALQADGWLWRDTVIWAKKPAMPESVRGWTWTKHRIKIAEYERIIESRKGSLQQQREGAEDGARTVSEASCFASERETYGDGTDATEERERSAAFSNAGTPGQAKGISSPLSSDGEGQGDESKEECSTVSVGDGDRSSVDLSPVVGSSESKQVPLLLLQTNDPIDDRPRDSSEQGRATRERERGPCVWELQLAEARQNGDAFIDCPGCPKCADNGGLVLRKGSWRCTSAHEYIFMLTKDMGYYCDAEAVRLPHVEGWKGSQFINGKTAEYGLSRMSTLRRNEPSGSNRRSVWNDISPEPYGGAHFATFPSDLPRICIQASTSEQGCCPKCGSQWARVIDHKNMSVVKSGNTNGMRTGLYGTQSESASTQTLGWRPTCACKKYGLPLPPEPSTILDPFCGTATTCLAAQRLGRQAVGMDLSEDYLKQAVKRLEAVSLPLGIPP